MSTSRADPPSASRRFDALLERLPVALLLIDAPRGVVLDLNLAASALLGLPRDTVRGAGFESFCSQPLSQGFLSYCARSFEPLPGAFRARRDGGELGFRCEGHRVAADSAEVLVRFWPLDEHDRFALLTQKVDELAREVQHRRRVQHELEVASRAKDEFLAMLGHELRNPLAPMKTALHLMELRAPQVCVRERDVLMRQVSSFSRLVDDLLDVSRIAQGKLDLKRERVDLRECVAKAVELATPLMVERAHRLDLDAPASPAFAVTGDAGRLAQVFANLLINAAKYTDRGGRVKVDLALDGDDVVVGVSDNGIGISSTLLPNIFELFSQETRGLDRAQGGLGLGLAIVRSIVALHQGSVSAHSDGPGRGSRFVVRLPRLVEAAVAPPDVPRPRADAARERAKVLIVDDNVDAAELLGETLAELGYVARVANDGPQALRLVEDFTPSVALLDIGLPVMSGFELAQRLRAMPRLGSVRLVAITGYGQASDRQRSRAAGFDAHLVKPVDIDELTELVGRLVGETPG